MTLIQHICPEPPPWQVLCENSDGPCPQAPFLLLERAGYKIGWHIVKITVNCKKCYEDRDEIKEKMEGQVGGGLIHCAGWSQRSICLLIVYDSVTASCDLLMVYRKMRFIYRRLFIHSIVYSFDTVYWTPAVCRHSSRSWGSSSQQDHKTINSLMPETQLIPCTILPLPHAVYHDGS